jgi:hypothetical protein
MDNKDRRQIMQRYVVEKSLAGADLKEISKGIVDPVAQMKTITAAKPADRPSSDAQVTFRQAR